MQIRAIPRGIAVVCALPGPQSRRFDLATYFCDRTLAQMLHQARAHAAASAGHTIEGPNARSPAAFSRDRELDGTIPVLQ